MKFPKKDIRLGHRIFVMSVVFSLVGAFFVLEASSSLALEVFGDRLHFFKNQLSWTLLAVVLMIIVSKIKLSLWQKTAKPLFILALIFLVAVLIPSVGTSALGARRWINFQFFVLQPSELAKLAGVIFFAKLLSEKDRLHSFTDSVDYLSFALVGWILILLEPDLGTSLVFMAIVFSQFFVSRFPVLKIGLILLPFVAVVLLVILVSPYRRERLESYISGVKLETASYHSKQMVYALALGGPFGVGLGNSTQKELFLPEASTDSVFAIVAEEVGFVGSVVILGFYVFFVSLLFKVSARTQEGFPRFVAVGVTSWLAVQSLVNLASVTGIIPITGVPLPFFSYGGSNLCTIMVGLGLLIAASDQKPA